MISIRPMGRNDLDAVASLYERVVRSGSATPAPGLRAWFERTLFDHPWMDADIPPLVAVDDRGGVVGALGSHVRRLRIDGEPARLAVSGQLVVAPEGRHLASGALLMRAYFAGPQELTITDGATEVVRSIWERLGGDAAPLQCIEWWRPLRAWRSATAVWQHRRERRNARPLPAVLGRVADTLDSVSPSLVRRLGRAPATAEPLTSASLTGALPAITGRLRLIPDYDPMFIEWLMAELAAITVRGELRARLVRDSDGVARGYFVYYLVRGGLSPVIALVAPNDAMTALVLDALIEDADAGAAAALHGRLEPRLLEPLARHRAFLRYVGGALAYAPNPAILALAISRHALLTRLEGEWWMAPHLGAAVH
jgi:hypothetical protein